MVEPLPRTADQFFPGLFGVLHTLEPCLPRVVLVGGWVPYLLARVAPGTATNEPLFTRDIDLAVPLDLHADAQRIDALLVESGLRSEFRSMYDPPAMAFVGSIGGAEVEVEFLTDEPGGQERVVKLGGRLHVQSLHYTRILLDNTTTIPVVGPDERVLTVRIPTAAAFVFNKGLTFPQRKTREKKAKDLYYIFEVLESGSSPLAGFAEDIVRLGDRYVSWYRKLKKNLSRPFGQVGDEGVDLVISQRPAGAFPGMGDDQFAQYVFATFAEFVQMLS